MSTFLDTGGAGSIGSNFIHYVLESTDHRVIVQDKLTDAGNRFSLEGLPANRMRFMQGDIADVEVLNELMP